MILVAFTVLHVGALHEWSLHELYTLFFPVPTAQQIHQATHGSIPGDSTRLRQLRLHEPFALPVSVADRHEVIEVLDDSS